MGSAQDRPTRTHELDGSGGLRGSFLHPFHRRRAAQSFLLVHEPADHPAHFRCIEPGRRTEGRPADRRAEVARTPLPRAAGSCRLPDLRGPRHSQRPSLRHTGQGSPAGAPYWIFRRGHGGRHPQLIQRSAEQHVRTFLHRPLQARDQPRRHGGTNRPGGEMVRGHSGHRLDARGAAAHRAGHHLRIPAENERDLFHSNLCRGGRWDVAPARARLRGLHRFGRRHRLDLDRLFCRTCRRLTRGR